MQADNGSLADAGVDDFAPWILTALRAERRVRRRVISEKWYESGGVFFNAIYLS